MESAKSLCKKLLNFKNTIITGCEFYTDTDNVNHIRIQARPDKRHENECPYCHNRALDMILVAGSPASGEGLTGAQHLSKSNIRRIALSVLTTELSLPMFRGRIPAAASQRILT